MNFWSGGKALSQRLDPYDVEVWIPLRAQYGSSWEANPASLYPLWTNALFVPFSLLDVDTAAMLWLTLSLIFLGASVIVLLTYYESRRPSIVTVVLPVGLALVSRATLLMLITGQLALLILLSLSLSLYLARRGRSFWSGVLLSTILLKPTPFILFAPLYGVWLVSRRRWPILLGAGTASACLFLASWLLQPGWVSGWLRADDMTFWTFITPTVWGLSSELAGDWWPIVGLLITMLVTIVLGWLVVADENLDEADAMSVALAGSLLVTPYLWAYEHILLILPVLFLSFRWTRRHLRIPVYVFLVVILPWALFAIAKQRQYDTLTALAPLTILIWYGLVLFQERTADPVYRHANGA